MRSAFRDLVAYQRAIALANALQREIAGWPSFERWTVGIQLARAADSVGANIAEASGRETPLDRRRLLVVARGSLLEAEHWIVTAQERELLGADSLGPLDEIVRTLEGLIAHQTRT